LIYLSVEHINKEGEVCHGKDVVGYWHALSSQLLDGMRIHLMGLLRQILSLAQVMTHHKAHVKNMALKNEHVT
jgi:predicted nucleotidyltransferase